MSQQLPTPVKFPAGGLKIGFLGRLVEDKNISLLLRSFRVLVDQSPAIGWVSDEEEANLHIFGDGPLRSILEGEANDLGVGELVHFHGALPQSEVVKAVASCHLFVFTSHVEGQCLAALEILACGRPIVATRSGAFPEILDDKVFGALVSNADPEGVASEIANVAGRLKRRDLCVGHIQELYNDRFGPETLGIRYENAILRLCVK